MGSPCAGWVTKKIKELMGMEEGSFCEFIMSQVGGKAGQGTWWLCDDTSWRTGKLEGLAVRGLDSAVRGLLPLVPTHRMAPGQVLVHLLESTK